MSIGERIRLIRKRKNLTQEQLAAKLSLKQATIVRYENSSITPSLGVLLRMALILKEDIVWLLTGEKKNGGKESESTTLKCPEVIKKAKVGKQNLNLTMLQELDSNKLARLAFTHKNITASVTKKKILVAELKEMRSLTQDLMDRIIKLQEEMKKGL